MAKTQAETEIVKCPKGHEYEAVCDDLGSYFCLQCEGTRVKNGPFMFFGPKQAALLRADGLWNDDFMIEQKKPLDIAFEYLERNFKL